MMVLIPGAALRRRGKDDEEREMVGRPGWERRQILALAVVGATALSFAGCDPKKSDPAPDPAGGASTSAGTQEPWKVGAYLSLSGAETQFGIETKEGIELAVDEVNQAGGAKGRQIKVLYE